MVSIPRRYAKNFGVLVFYQSTIGMFQSLVGTLKTCEKFGSYT